MQLIYRAGDIAEAHIIVGLLACHDIEAHVGGHYLQGGVGDLAAMDFATVHVADDDVERAMPVIAEYEQNTPTKKPEVQTSGFRSIVAPLTILLIALAMMLTLAIAFNQY